MITREEKLLKRKRAGRWAMAVLALLIAGALAWAWLDEAPRQTKILRTGGIVMGGFAAFLLWVLFGSQWPARARWFVLGGTVALMILAPLTLRIGGVSGDLLPIIEWRWKSARTIVTEQPRTPQSPPSTTLTNSYPQFLGPSRNGVLPGPALARDWQQTPPHQLWRHEVGAAWSGFAVAGPLAITQEQRGPEEAVICYDTLSGALVWQHTDTSRYATTIAGEGPRATPTISSNRVYTIGGAGVLNCLELATGKKVWSRDTVGENSAEVPEWGVASSPLVTDRAVIVAVGGNNRSLVAYHRDTGEKLWAGGHDSAHWSSAVRVTLAGVPQILIFAENVSSHDEQTGAVLWQYPWRSAWPHVTVPLVLSNDRVLVSQGYGVGSELLQITHTDQRWRAKQIWKSIRMKSKFANLIHIDGYVYGLDDGALACIDVNTGALQWKGDRYGHGQMILVNDLLLLMAESGDVVLLEPNPQEQRELVRHKVFNAKTWNPPALAGDLLLVRNDREAACLRLPVRTAAISPPAATR